MTQDELRENLKRYDLKGATIERLLAVRDTALDMQAQLQRIYDELRSYNGLVGLYANPDEVRDRINECLQAVADEADMYRAFVSRASDEIYKRLEK